MYNDTKQKRVRQFSTLNTTATASRTAAQDLPQYNVDTLSREIVLFRLSHDVTFTADWIESRMQQLTTGSHCLYTVCFYNNCADVLGVTVSSLLFLLSHLSLTVFQ